MFYLKNKKIDKFIEKHYHFDVTKENENHYQLITYNYYLG